MQRLSIAAFGAAFIALGIFGTAPATAALLDFSFTTESGGTGSFTLDTDAAPGSVPATIIFGDGPVEEGIQYTKAISNFSFSSPSTSFSNLTGDYGVYPSIPFAPNSRGVLSIVGTPSGDEPDEFYLADIGLEYLGNVSELPVLSDDPRSYCSLDRITVYDSIEFTANVITADPITDLQVVPETGSILGTLAVGIGGTFLLLKRN